MRIEQPPSTVTGELRDYLVQVSAFINAAPVVSFFSGNTPNSVLTGGCGHFAINLGSVSTLSRVWVNAAPPSSGITNQGWNIVRIVTP